MLVVGMFFSLEELEYNDFFALVIDIIENPLGRNTESELCRELRDRDLPL